MRPEEGAPAATRWCDHCNRLVATSEVLADEEGRPSCPRCHEPLDDPSAALEEVSEEHAAPKPPWHFKVLLVGTVCYLIYRVIWFGFWISHHV